MVQQHITGLATYELKVGRFKPEYAGKMNFYLNLLDAFISNQDTRLEDMADDEQSS